MSHYFLEDKGLADDFRDFPYYFGTQAFRFTSNSGVFCHGAVDRESDLLIHSVPALNGELLDLGCGYGVIGITLAKAYGLHATLSDVNARALRCAERNAAQNGINATILQSDGFERIPGLFDAITLNPPIHAGREVITRLFGGAREHLKPGGAFYIVMLEKHGAKRALQELRDLFLHCEILYKKKGEYVIACQA